MGRPLEESSTTGRRLQPPIPCSRPAVPCWAAARPDSTARPLQQSPHSYSLNDCLTPPPPVTMLTVSSCRAGQRGRRGRGRGQQLQQVQPSAPSLHVPHPRPQHAGPPTHQCEGRFQRLGCYQIWRALVHLGLCSSRVHRAREWACSCTPPAACTGRIPCGRTAEQGAQSQQQTQRLTFVVQAVEPNGLVLQGSPPVAGVPGPAPLGLGLRARSGAHAGKGELWPSSRLLQAGCLRAGGRRPRAGPPQHAPARRSMPPKGRRAMRSAGAKQWPGCAAQARRTAGGSASSSVMFGRNFMFSGVGTNLRAEGAEGARRGGAVGGTSRARSPGTAHAQRARSAHTAHMARSRVIRVLERPVAHPHAPEVVQLHPLGGRGKAAGRLGAQAGGSSTNPAASVAASSLGLSLPRACLHTPHPPPACPHLDAGVLPGIEGQGALNVVVGVGLEARMRHCREARARAARLSTLRRLSQRDLQRRRARPRAAARGAACGSAESVPPRPARPLAWVEHRGVVAGLEHALALRAVPRLPPAVLRVRSLRAAAAPKCNRRFGGQAGRHGGPASSQLAAPAAGHTSRGVDREQQGGAERSLGARNPGEAAARRPPAEFPASLRKRARRCAPSRPRARRWGLRRSAGLEQWRVNRAQVDGAGSVVPAPGAACTA